VLSGLTQTHLGLGGRDLLREVAGSEMVLPDFKEARLSFTADPFRVRAAGVETAARGRGDVVKPVDRCAPAGFFGEGKPNLHGVFEWGIILAEGNL
jgi:hypothetical protein